MSLVMLVLVLISQVGTSLKEKYLKPDSLSDRQPVQLYKERSSMVIFPGAVNQSSSGVLNQLQFFDNTLRKTIEKGITVIQF